MATRTTFMHRWLAVPATVSVALILAACQAGSASSSASASASAAESASASASESASASASASAAGAAVEITVVDTDAGQALAGKDEMTLYTFDNDSAGVSACSGGCAENWPPLVVADDSDVTAGEGVTGEIDTITRDDGSLQVTYNGQPLYYFAADQAPGDSTGDGVGGVWHIATAEAGAASAGDKTY